jgi:hypothetical protein
MTRTVSLILGFAAICLTATSVQVARAGEIVAPDDGTIHTTKMVDDGTIHTTKLTDDGTIHTTKLADAT